jgi:hypothetical protein
MVAFQMILPSLFYTERSGMTANMNNDNNHISPLQSYIILSHTHTYTHKNMYTNEMTLICLIRDNICNSDNDLYIIYLHSPTRRTFSIIYFAHWTKFVKITRALMKAVLNRL